MATLQGIVARLKALLFRNTTERDLSEELRFHIELETEKNVRAGLPPAEARRKALVDFGGIEVAREAHRDVRGRWLEDLAADVRYALRTLRRRPVLTGAAVITLALGIGANTAIFSAVNAVVLRPLPFERPGELMMLHEENAEKGWHNNVIAPANYLDWQERTRAFEDVAAYTGWAASRTLTGQGEPRLLMSARVTGNLFSVLGVKAEQGRTFTAAESWQTGSSIVMISHRLWQQLGGGADIVGKSLVLDGRPREVVGVTPPGFAFPFESADLYVPTEWRPEQRSLVSFRRAHSYRAIARLRPGATRAAADAEFQTVVRQLQVEYPETNRVMGAAMTPLQDFLIGDTRQPLLMLLGAVALLMLIACANVGNLALVQAAGREREAALRLTLGAGRGRLIRQALTESVVLALVGGAAGVLLGWYGTKALARLQPAGMLPVERVDMDWVVLLYVLAITTASGLLFGIAPALWSGRRAPAEVLKEGGRSGASSRVRRWGDLLVIAEVSLALVLTLGAGLLVHSYIRLQRVGPGFDPTNTLAVSLGLPSIRYDSTAKIDAFFAQLSERARALPGVTGVTSVAIAPFNGPEWTSDYIARGRPADQYGTEVAHREMDWNYHEVMRVPLRRGRYFTAADRAESQPVVIINEALAKRYFAGQDPVGQLISDDRVPDSTSTWYSIVGVVADERQTSLAVESQIEMVTPFAQQTRSYRTVMVRTTGDPMLMAPSIRRAIADIDPSIALTSVGTLDEAVAGSIARQRFIMTLLFSFALTGFLLAVVGVYGVMAQMAKGRTREMGIRMALGARAEQVQWMVVRHGLRLAAGGLALGILGALATGRLIRGLLYDVAPTDPLTFVAVPIAMAATAVAASWLPARRASRTSPAVTLHED